MTSTRLEAFSDAVIAILMTIMVLELKIPHGTDLEALAPLLPIFLTYVLSFINLGIYWNNHHHMLHTTEKVAGGIMWANMHLLFWLSLFPFATGWMGENHFAPIPTAAYGVVLFMAAVAYYILQRTIIAHQGRGSLLASAIGKDWKGKLSPALYLAPIILSFVNPWVASAVYVAVALMWLIPDKPIEQRVEQEQK